MLDTDCPAGSFCSSDITRPICRCFGGLDGCDQLATCQAIPAAPTAPAFDTRSDCQKCQDCIAVVKDWAAVSAVQTAASSNNSLQLASLFMPKCTGNLTTNDILKCKGISGAISMSYNGNLGKRAGALCAYLGSCAGDAATDKCNVTSTARLDLCTLGGGAGGQTLPLPTTGVCGLVYKRTPWRLHLQQPA